MAFNSMTNGVQVPALMAAMGKPKQQYLGPPQQVGQTDPFTPGGQGGTKPPQGFQQQGGRGRDEAFEKMLFDPRLKNDRASLFSLQETLLKQAMNQTSAIFNKNLFSSAEESQKYYQDLLKRFRDHYGGQQNQTARQSYGQPVNIGLGGGGQSAQPTTSSQPHSVQTPLDPRGGMTYQMPGQFQGFDVAKWEGQY